MSHKQKTDCTAGLRAFCDYGTHDSTAWTLQAGSLYDCICRSDIAVTLIEMTDELEDQRGGCRFLIPFYKGLLVWDKTAKLELIMSFVLSFNHGGQSRGRNVRLIHPFYSTVPARSCQKKKKKSADKLYLYVHAFGVVAFYGRLLTLKTLHHPKFQLIQILFTLYVIA